MRIASDFFRSMSLAEDLREPARFAHYRPTTRNIAIVRAVADRGATMVIAPYGSGKSLAAGVAALHVRNAEADRRASRPIIQRLGSLDPAVASRFAARAKTHRRGVIVTLTGFEAEPLATIGAALGMKRTPKRVEDLVAAMRNGTWDHVAIIWDEFGRHLETLVALGRSGELDLVQRIAERTARANEPTASLTLLLHQNLLAYASRLNETSRTDWLKIEGRFAQLRIVEDSREIYQLIGEVVASIRPKGMRGHHPSSETIDDVIAAKWLDGIDDRAAVANVLSCAWPLSASALHVLPALVARVGQNERSLFSFLQEADLGERVTIETVYRSFSDAMRTDIGIGGTYRRWVETESARSRARTPLQRQILAAACLLQLGTGGERRRLPRSVLSLAIDEPAIIVAREIDTLVEDKLLLWRRHNDDVAVWHGADIDVALRVREERERRSAAFDLQTFLEERFTPPFVRPSRHNARFGVQRFFAGRYQPAKALLAGDATDATDAGDEDAAVVYLLADDQAELDATRQKVSQPTDDRIMYVVPDRALELSEAAVELLALEALKKDGAFLASDPLVPTELDELYSVAFEQLASTLRNLLDPRGMASSWFAQGCKLDVSADRPASMAASRLFDAWFPLTPRISNEQLMRNKASRTMQTARVRVVGAILQKTDLDRLGYDAADGGAEASVYRTILENTGLHVPEEGRFAPIDGIADPALAEVWATIAAFFREPTPPDDTRPLASLLATLADRPTGVPRGVMPILVAAGYKAFGRAVTFYRRGAYIDDILGFQFDQLMMSPEGVTVRVEKTDLVVTHYLRELCYVFAHRRPQPDEDLINAAIDSLRRWSATIPESAKRSNRLGAAAKAMLRVVGASANPPELLLRDMPEAFGLTGPDPKVIAFVERARNEIDRLQDTFTTLALETTAEAFRSEANGQGLVDAVRAWGACFDAAAMDARNDLRVSDKAVLRKAVETANGRFSPKSFVASLSSILIQRGLDRWDDRTAANYRAALRECRDRIEAAALDVAVPSLELRPLIRARMDELQSMLERMEGADAGASPSLRTVGGNG